VGWNLVAAFHQAAFQNLGQTHVLDHAERYERADEYLDLCYRLWDSWEEDAVVMDSAGNTFADPTKVHEVNFEGKWFQCRGPLNIHRSPQGKPVIAQAGQSDQGREFAARHAEMIFSIQPYRDGMQEYYTDVKARMRKCGRDPDTCKILFGMQPVVGETQDSAQAKADFHNALLTPEEGLVQLSAVLGQDLSQLNLDDPLTTLPPVAGIRGLVDAYTRSGEGKEVTIRDMALDMSRGVSVPQVIGTPEQVADRMQETMEIAGGDGFILSPLYLPGSIEEFASMVVPVLQQRGLVRTEYIDGTLRDNLLAF
jgi:FMN-dependent oxidoreductase (nitrilotriacetate monooxygenase family)